MIVVLILNLYTVDGISINVHDLICVAGWIDTREQDLTSKQCILKHCYSTLNNTAWLQIMKVIDALRYVHGLGIIHHDLKTDNIVFYCCSDFLQPVIDFGKCVYACSAKKFMLSEAKKVEYH